MEAEPSETGLLAALNTCADSAPGPDGVPFGDYEKLWCIAGWLILNFWKHTCNTGLLPAWHSNSAITFLPKEGKDTKDIKN
jgi:hypothetical protein